MEFTSLIQKTVNNIETKKRIVIVDGDDDRAIEASKILEQYQNCEVILLTEKDITINTKATVINIHADADKKAQLAQLMFEQREARQAKGKENKDTLEVCQKAIEQRPFYAMMLLQNGEVDGVVGGLIYSTADMLRANF